MRDVAQVHALGQVLSDEAIGVLVRATLPRAVGVAEVDVHVQVGTELLVQRHLRASVVGHRLSQALGDAPESTLEACEDVFGGVAIELDQHDVTAQSLDQGAHRGAVHGAFDEIAFPVPGNDPCSHLWRAQRDRFHVGQAALARRAASAWQTRLVTHSQQVHQLGSQRVARHGVNGAVDRLVRHRQRHEVRRLAGLGMFHQAKFARDLLRRPMTLQTTKHGTPERGLHVGTELSSGMPRRQAPRPHAQLRRSCTIAAGQRRRRGLASDDFSADGRRAAANFQCDRAAAEFSLEQKLDRDAIGFAQVRVVSSHLWDTLQDERCRTSNLRPP